MDVGATLRPSTYSANTIPTAQTERNRLTASPKGHPEADKYQEGLSSVLYAIVVTSDTSTWLVTKFADARSLIITRESGHDGF